jgi:hypothetical protein
VRGKDGAKPEAKSRRRVEIGDGFPERGRDTHPVALISPLALNKRLAVNSRRSAWPEGEIDASSEVN